MQNEVSLNNFLNMLQKNIANTQTQEIHEENPLTENKNIAVLERLKTLNENDKIKQKPINPNIQRLNELNKDFHEYSQFQKFKKR